MKEEEDEGFKPRGGLTKLLLGTLGILTLASCTTFKPIQKSEELMRLEFLQDYRIALEYDTDGDDIGDTKYFYRVRPEQNMIWFSKPYAVARDKNRNEIYDSDEYEYFDESQEPEEKKTGGIRTFKRVSL